MAILDTRFVVTSDLEGYFVAQDGSGPLAGGIITFYSQTNPNVLKPVYELTVSGSSIAYNPLPNPMQLSDVGTYQDANGNNIVPYYYPFTGTPAQNTNVSELYYITVSDSNLVPQFTRSYWPNSGSSGGGGGGGGGNAGVNVINYIPNGQFLSHNNIVSATEPPVTTYTFGGSSVNAQPIAQGGWEFVTSASGTSIFNNSFSAYPVAGGWGLSSYPKFVFNYVCTSYNSSNSYYDLQITFPDVNKFSANVNPTPNSGYTAQAYNLFFDVSGNGVAQTFTIYGIQYYGTGGSPANPVIRSLGSFTTTTGFSSINIQNITFPFVSANQLGTNGDDYVAIAIRGPTSSFNASFSDFALTIGTTALTVYPTKTNAEMLSEGVAGWMPTPSPTGQDLFLPLILTPQGMVFDHSQIGTIISDLTTYPSGSSPVPANTTLYNKLPLFPSYTGDPMTYLVGGYSSIGVPYSRLFNYLVANSPVANTPLFGTGALFVTATTNTSTSFILTINTSGGGDPVASGALTFTGSNPTYTFTVNSVPTSAYYWTFQAYNGATNIPYYVWYNTGASTDPAPGGTGIMVSVTGSDTTATITTKTLIALNSYQFALPNLQGYFLRQLDTVGANDTNYTTRSLAALGLTGANIGSTELAAFLNHTHAFDYAHSNVTGSGGTNVFTTGGSGGGSLTGTSSTGGTETRPINFAVNYFIVY